MARVWYKVLDRLPGGARILDVGIGTATALVKPENKEILERKNIVVVESTMRKITSTVPASAWRRRV